MKTEAERNQSAELSRHWLAIIVDLDELVCGGSDRNDDELALAAGGSVRTIDPTERTLRLSFNHFFFAFPSDPPHSIPAIMVNSRDNTLPHRLGFSRKSSLPTLPNLPHVAPLTPLDNSSSPSSDISLFQSTEDFPSPPQTNPSPSSTTHVLSNSQQSRLKVTSKPLEWTSGSPDDRPSAQRSQDNVSRRTTRGSGLTSPSSSIHQSPYRYGPKQRPYSPSSSIHGFAHNVTPPTAATPPSPTLSSKIGGKTKSVLRKISLPMTTLLNRKNSSTVWTDTAGEDFGTSTTASTTTQQRRPSRAIESSTSLQSNGGRSSIVGAILSVPRPRQDGSQGRFTRSRNDLLSGRPSMQLSRNSNSHRRPTSARRQKTQSAQTMEDTEPLPPLQKQYVDKGVNTSFNSIERPSQEVAKSKPTRSPVQSIHGPMPITQGSEAQVKSSSRRSITRPDSAILPKTPPRMSPELPAEPATTKTVSARPKESSVSVSTATMGKTSPTISRRSTSINSSTPPSSRPPSQPLPAPPASAMPRQEEESRKGNTASARHSGRVAVKRSIESLSNRASDVKGAVKAESRKVRETVKGATSAEGTDSTPRSSTIKTSNGGSFGTQNQQIISGSHRQASSFRPPLQQQVQARLFEGDKRSSASYVTSQTTLTMEKPNQPGRAATTDAVSASSKVRMEANRGGLAKAKGPPSSSSDGSRGRTTPVPQDSHQRKPLGAVERQIGTSVDGSTGPAKRGAPSMPCAIPRPSIATQPLRPRPVPRAMPAVQRPQQTQQQQRQQPTQLSVSSRQPSAAEQRLERGRAPSPLQTLAQQPLPARATTVDIPPLRTAPAPPPPLAPSSWATRTNNNHSNSPSPNSGYSPQIGPARKPSRKTPPPLTADLLEEEELARQEALERQWIQQQHQQQQQTKKKGVSHNLVMEENGKRGSERGAWER